ncbi:MAG TPA: hypothetical protein VFF39_00160 [Verrucomicrobiae bacterium]|nr:hypothetical protein [Verrucomicrobiae bacterium]
MELLDRYLHAVRFWLPKAHQQDIIDELRDDLASQIEDKEAALGRPLTDDEMVALLQQTGLPMRIAGRYQPQQSLIGPALFPLYKFVMKMVSLGYLLPWLLVWMGLEAFVPSYRAEHTIMGVFGSFWKLAISTLGIITLMFAVLDRFQSKVECLQKWDPRQLPAVPKSKDRVRRVESVFELLFSMLFIMGWMAAPRIAREVFAPASKYLTLNPALHVYYWLVLVPAVIGMVQQAINLFRPRWTWLRPPTRVVTTAITLGLAESMVKLSPFFALVPGTLTNAKDAALYATIEFTLNQFSWWGLVIFSLALCIALVVETYRCVKMLRQSNGDGRGGASVQISQLL